MKDSDRVKLAGVVAQGNSRNSGAIATIASSAFSRRQILKAAGGFVAGAASGSVPLITNLISGSTLNSPAQAQISRLVCVPLDRLVCVPLESGSIISFECLGDIRNSKYVYLDGKTKEGEVGLVPINEGIYTGTKWRVDRRQSTSVGTYYTFYCLGDIPGPNYLDGRTGNNSVALAPGYGEGRYTGARWWVYTDGNSYLFRCLGTPNEPKWLNGITTDGKVDLAPSYEGIYTGTKWRLTYYQA